MPMLLKGSCRCGAVRFEVESHTPAPYQLCYCSICRKQQGGGGYAINLGAVHETMRVAGRENLGVYRAEIRDEEHAACEISTGERNFCTKCGSAMWLYDPTWPDLVHPFASAVDTDLPAPGTRTHLMLKYKASWVEPHIADGDKAFDLYPQESIAPHRGGQEVGAEGVRPLSAGIHRRLAQTHGHVGEVIQDVRPRRPPPAPRPAP